MGGNALKHVTTRRYHADEYQQICQDVTEKLRQAFPHQRMAVIPSYQDKQDFGDMDLLFESTESVDWKSVLTQLFHSKEIVHNGTIWSFEFRAFQIDLILAPPQEFEPSLIYFSYNDLGNLMGRVAHKMGFKYGHQGLLLPLKYKDHLWAEPIVSREPSRIFQFLGYDFARYQQWFTSLESIFDFVVNTPYFHKDIYLYHNRNSTSRIRDKKRPTYTKFLQWLEQQTALPYSYTWSRKSEQGGREYQEEFVQRAYQNFPEFIAQHQQIQQDLQQHIQFKALFNGEKVREITQLQDQELGRFMQHLIRDSVVELGTPLKDWALSHPDQVDTMILNQYRQYMHKPPYHS